MNVFSPRSDPEAKIPFMPEQPLEMMRKGRINKAPYITGEYIYITSSRYISGLQIVSLFHVSCFLFQATRRKRATGAATRSCPMSPTPRSGAISSPTTTGFCPWRWDCSTCNTIPGRGKSTTRSSNATISEIPTSYNKAG